MKRVYISGYRSYELGVFKEDDPKIKIIKNVIKKNIVQLIEEGLEWIMLGGNLGVEMWACDVCIELKEDYPELSLAAIFPFEGFGEQWNEKNQTQLMKLKTHADFCEATSHKPYETPQQLRNHTQFLLSHTDGALLIYDEEYPGKTSYLHKDIKKLQEQGNYELWQVTMDDLQNSQEHY